MLASELLGSKWLDEHEDIDITGIAYDSRNVLPETFLYVSKALKRTDINMQKWRLKTVRH
ncbi:MAG: hypothetical protein ACLTG2_11075 [Clostridia bacterium]